MADPELRRRVEVVGGRHYVVATDPATSGAMRRVGRSSTPPELRVRHALWALGVRYRTANRDLPGAPDIANRAGCWAVFVHGCFWHHHHGCARAYVPTRNREFWRAKFAANAHRDLAAERALRSLGYTVIVIWECQTRDRDALAAVLQARVPPRKAPARGRARRRL